jgi:hypothetical protein
LFFPTISDVTVKDIDWLRKFRNLFTAFDRFAQEVPEDRWPKELFDEYQKLKFATNAIDLSVVL